MSSTYYIELYKYEFVNYNRTTPWTNQYKHFELFNIKIIFVESNVLVVFVYSNWERFFNKYKMLYM